MTLKICQQELLKLIRKEREKKSLKTPTRQNIQELWDCFNRHNVCVVGKPEREERMEKKKY